MQKKGNKKKKRTDPRHQRQPHGENLRKKRGMGRNAGREQRKERESNEKGDEGLVKLNGLTNNKAKR